MADQPPINTGESNTNVSDQSRDVIDPGKTGPDDAATAEDPAQHADAKPPVGDADAPESEDEPTPLTEPDAQRPEPATTEDERGSEQPPASNDAPRRIELKVDGRPIREYLDPIGAKGGTVEGHVPHSADRIGDRVAAPDENEKSRADKARRAIFERASDIRDISDAVEKSAKKLLEKPPPTGHAEISTASRMKPTDNMKAGDAVVGLLALGLVLGEGARHGLRMLDRVRRKENEGNG